MAKLLVAGMLALVMTGYGTADGDQKGRWEMRVKLTLVPICILASAGVSWGQSALWLPQNATTGNIYYNGGNVGIGTSSPSFNLSVQASGVNSALELNNAGTGGHDWLLSSQSGGGSPGALLFYDNSSGGTRVIILSSGNVGVGTTNPQHLLQVAGTIGAEEILVSSTGADYVFAPGYRLRPLSEVATYIEANHHLPDIPSADEAREKGVSVGEMQSKLLAKVEELTLHLIQADERNSRLERDNLDLRKAIQDVKELIGR